MVVENEDFSDEDQCQGKYTLENSSHVFSSYNVSILIFQKMINKYNKTFNKKIYTLNWENVKHNFVRLVWHFSPQLFISVSAKYFQLKALKAMEILTGGQMRGPGKI